MGTKNISNEREGMNIICVICLIIFAFMPTSQNGVIFGLQRTILVWLTSTIVCILSLLHNRASYGKIVLSFFFCLTYMTIVTLAAQTRYSEYHVSLARIAPLMVLLLLVEIRFCRIPSSKVMLFLLNAFSIIAIVWNAGIMMRFQPITDFTYNWYTQYFDLAVYYSVIQSAKPVMTFGVHTYAAYYYFIFFLLCLFTYEKTHKDRYLVYAVCFMGFSLFLVSSTAIIFFFIMAAILSFRLIKDGRRKTFILFLAALAIMVVILIKNSDYLYQKLYYNMTNGQNSFVSRYSSNSVFTENMKVITSSLGIGFNIIDELQLGYSDSGYVVYLTMGNVPLMLYLYYKLYYFLRFNIPAVYRKSIILVVLLFDFALPATFQYRFSFSIIFVIEYLKMLENMETTSIAHQQNSNRK